MEPLSFAVFMFTGQLVIFIFAFLLVQHYKFCIFAVDCALLCFPLVFFPYSIEFSILYSKKCNEMTKIKQNLCDQYFLVVLLYLLRNSVSFYHCFRYYLMKFLIQFIFYRIEIHALNTYNAHTHRSFSHLEMCNIACEIRL